MKQMISISALAAIVTLSSPSVFADKSHYKKDNYRYQDSAYVTRVEPIYKHGRISTPSRNCHNQYTNGQNRYYKNSYTPAIAGGLIGGVIGNQFGDGSAQIATTLVGTAIGGVIAHKLAYDNQSYYGYRNQSDCRANQRHHKQKQIDSYKVTYKYQGKKFTTIMDHHPGKRIPISVSVRPLTRYY